MNTPIFAQGLADITLEELHKLDLLIACPACDALKGRSCKGLDKKTCHFGRRLKWLLMTRGMRK